MPDARNTCTSIENYSTSSFTSFEIVGNNEKAEKLGLKWIETEKRNSDMNDCVFWHYIVTGDEKLLLLQ